VANHLRPLILGAHARPDSGNAGLPARLDRRLVVGQASLGLFPLEDGRVGDDVTTLPDKGVEHVGPVLVRAPLSLGPWKALERHQPVSL